uniref:SCP domain-containing protein n=1 Tax=Romanomermis culicivorax TaxID=13658 RepID=A0A915K6W0_ROMCU
VWDQRLADVSKHLASTCLAQHSHPSYRWSKAGFRQIGESLWWRYEHHMRRNVRWFVQDLYNEKPFYNFDTDYCRPREMCGHYKQMVEQLAQKEFWYTMQVVWANSCAIGCAAAYCRHMFDSLKNAWYTGHLVVCHYGPA